MENKLQQMKEKQVVVKTGDVSYRGRLVEIGEDSVCLMARTGWREVAMDRIITIELLAEEGESDED